ncbi:MAG: carbonic anhydrase [Halobacteriovoraceae bacterium]|nr:carbonic anhydrase [Halobacteriovoraceae bacterium]|tara:strand:+ start:858 stop:1424 length:567 start_codon:yes stop_codon:yes gene_type:complete
MYAYKGYEKYKNEKLSDKASELAKLKDGQSPNTLFITCSDSRICPNEMTSTKEGELFVIRNAGNSIPHERSSQGNADAATLEYAVKVLGVKEIVVCGHSHCGAVNALLGGVDATELPVIASYLQHLNELKSLSLEKKLSPAESINENVRFQIANIKSYDFVQKAVDNGLKIYGWLYHIENGDVEVLED